MTSESILFMFHSRGVGNNWLPCFICGHRPTNHAQPDLAGFVDPGLLLPYKEGDPAGPHHRIEDLFFEAGLLVGAVEINASDRVQVKLGACNEHKPNLMLLDQLVRFTGQLTLSVLQACIPGRKLP